MSIIYESILVGLDSFSPNRVNVKDFHFLKFEHARENNKSIIVSCNFVCFLSSVDYIIISINIVYL